MKHQLSSSLTHPKRKHTLRSTGCQEARFQVFSYPFYSHRTARYRCCVMRAEMFCKSQLCVLHNSEFTKHLSEWKNKKKNLCSRHSNGQKIQSSNWMPRKHDRKNQNRSNALRSILTLSEYKERLNSLAAKKGALQTSISILSTERHKTYRKKRTLIVP